MPQYTFQAPNGKTYTVEGDHEPSQSEMAEIASSQGYEPPKQEVQQETTGNFLNDLGNKLTERINTAKTDLADNTQGSFSKGLQAAGQVAGGIFDIPTTAISSGLKAAENLPIVGGGVKALKDLAGTALSKYIEDTNKIPGIQQGNEAIQQAEQAHPEATRNIGALGNIASVLPVGVSVDAAMGAGRFATGKALEIAGNATGKTATGITPLLTKLSMKESPLAKEAIETASSKTGRDALASSFKQEPVIGKNLIDNLEGEQFAKRLEESNKQIGEALQKTPRINLDNTINALENAKTTGARILPNEQKANRAIDEYITALRGDEKQTSNLTMSPNEFIDIRRRLDSNIPWDDPTKKLVDKALFDARQSMAQELINNAPVQYKPAMEDVASALQARDAVLDDVAGATPKDKLDNVENYIRNIHGIGKTNKQDVLAKLDKIMGTTYLDQAKKAALAKQFGEESGGLPGLATRHGTGYGGTQLAALGASGAEFARGNILPSIALAGTAAMQSPYVATRVIGGLKKTESGLKELGKKLLRK